MRKKNPWVAKSYDGLLQGVVHLLEEARRGAARSVNAILTATYWEIGRRIVEHEQQGKRRAVYGEALIERLAHDLTGRFGRGFSRRNLFQMREFYATWPIVQTASAQLGAGTLTGVTPEKRQTPSDELGTDLTLQNLRTVSRKFGPLEINTIP
jgi:hypothetical protein